MLRVGLTGGIGSGKSAVARRLGELGALVVDSDVLAREVVQPGSEGLAAVVGRFGPEVLAADGSLDRSALARRVFADADARRDLEALTHPRIAARAADLMAAAAPGQVVVHDVPLLVEKAMAAAYDLVVVVAASEQVRVERLVRERGMSAAEAWARVRAQASDEQRRAVADVWLPNDGDLAALVEAVDRLWRERILPLNDALLARRPGPGQPSR